MKKYILLSFLFLLAITPVLAKGSTDAQGQQGQATSNATTGSQTGNNQVNQVTTITASPTKKPTISPTDNQVKNENEVQTKNQGKESQLSVKTQESEQLNQVVDESVQKVSDYVHQLIEERKTTGIKGGIGEKVSEFAQSQTKLQDEVKADIKKLNSRSKLTKTLIGSDKKIIKSMKQKMEQNSLMIKQLEQLKLETKNNSDLQQLQETIDLMSNQNMALQNKINKESDINGMFGWLINLFNK